MYTLYRLPIIVCLLIAVTLSAQTRKISAIKQDIIHAHSGEEKLKAVFRLCEENESLHTDTLAYYAQLAMQLAKTYSADYSQERAGYYIAYAYYRKGKTDSALALLHPYIDAVGRQSPGSSLDMLFRLLKARSQLRLREYKQALSDYYSILTQAEKNNDTLNRIMAMNGIATVLNRTGDKKGALGWYLKGIALSSRPAYRDKTIFLYTNTAVLYNTFSQYDSAAWYVSRAVDYARAAENLSDLTNALGMYAGNMMDIKKFNESEKALKEAIAVSEQIGDPNDIISHMGALAVFYYDRGEPQKGIAICQQAIQSIQKYGLISKLPFIYDILANNYQSAGKHQEAAATLRLLTDIKDSLYEVNSADALAEMKTRFEVQQKENTIIHQQLDLVRKDYLFYSSLALLFVALLSAFFIFRQYRKRQRLKEVMAVASAEETERKRIAADLHDNLGAYAASIASNVNRLSAGSATDHAALEELRNNSQSIVSDLSDTIWALKKESLTLTAVSDRLKVFIQRVQPSYPGITIDITETISQDHVLSPSQGFHLFQTLREAVNNALKHSGGNHIHIDVSGSDTEWKVTVNDNGRGMKLTEGSEDGNGLFNMKNRAAEAGWNIEWQSTGSGTRVTILEALI